MRNTSKLCHCQQVWIATPPWANFASYQVVQTHWSQLRPISNFAFLKLEHQAFGPGRLFRILQLTDYRYEYINWKNLILICAILGRFNTLTLCPRVYKIHPTHTLYTKVLNQFGKWRKFIKIWINLITSDNSIIS